MNAKLASLVDKMVKRSLSEEKNERKAREMQQATELCELYQYKSQFRNMEKD